MTKCIKKGGNTSTKTPSDNCQYKAEVNEEDDDLQLANN